MLFKCQHDIQQLKPRVREHTISKVDDKKPDHSNGSPSGSFVGWPLIFVFGKYGSNNEMAQGHPNCPNEENWFSPNLVDIPENSI